MEQHIFEIINTVLDNRNKERIKSINSSMNLRDDIGFDSLDLAELTVRIEAEYNIDVFEKNIVNTVGEIIELLKT